jgi:FkbM family methyltransferase
MVRLQGERWNLLPRRSFGLDQLDLKLAKYIRNRNGYFVETGGNDGIAQSNTLYFERYLGWRGLLIEPIPHLSEQCRRNRPRSHVEQKALVPFGYAQDTVGMTYCNLMSLVDGARGSAAADTAHLERGRKYLATEDRVEQLSVPATTLTDVLERVGAHHIDLLSLDVEGYEPQVLDGLDFDRFRPDWILVEANDRDAIATRLGARYDLVDVLSHHDVLYRAK